MPLPLWPPPCWASRRSGAGSVHRCPLWEVARVKQEGLATGLIKGLIKECLNLTFLKNPHDFRWFRRGIIENMDLRLIIGLKAEAETVMWSNIFPQWLSGRSRGHRGQRLPLPWRLGLCSGSMCTSCLAVHTFNQRESSSLTLIEDITFS